MSRLLLIRHGQASLGAADYDVLSPLGAVQSQALGRHLARMIDPPDAIYAGPRKRQRDTAAHLVAAAREQGADFPDPTERLEFDEYPALALMRDALASLCDVDDGVRSLIDVWRATEVGSREHRRAFERAFQAAMKVWHDGRVAHPEIEPFAAFQARVAAGLRGVVERHPRGHTVLVVTSAGPVGVMMALAQDLPTWSGLRASFVVHNAALTELAYRPDGLQLRSFNALPHLTDRGHVTHR